jgi:hypothetical protein
LQTSERHARPGIRLHFIDPTRQCNAMFQQLWRSRFTAKRQETTPGEKRTGPDRLSPVRFGTRERPQPRALWHGTAEKSSLVGRLVGGGREPGIQPSPPELGTITLWYPTLARADPCPPAP